jgi:metal transporter CNNM
MVTFLLVLIFIIGSAICSGLNIAIMSLKTKELERQMKLGSKRAKRVYDLRKNAHLTLAAILLSNVGFNSATALVLGDAFSGIVAGILTTLLLVTFAELMPQALFTKNALGICARLSPLIKIMIYITYPIALPLGKFMDKLFGKDEKHRLHSRRELGMIIGEHLGEETASELDEDEVEIIRGALQLSEKQVDSITTPIDEVYYLLVDDVIDDQKIEEITQKNRSRIPIFNAEKTICYGIVTMKEMVNVDFDEKPMPVSKMQLFPVKSVGSRTALDTLLRKFISAKTHMIPVEKNDEIIGIVTLEDLFEEIIGHELRDEADQLLDRE